MNCFFCKGTIKEGFSSYTADIDDCVIVIKKVPSFVCNQCGEKSYSDNVARQLEKIIKQIINSVKTEVAVVSYFDKAA